MVTLNSILEAGWGRRYLVTCISKGSCVGIYLPTIHGCPNWDLNLVLNALTVKPFELLAMIQLWELTYKVVFLVAVTSARRVPFH